VHTWGHNSQAWTQYPETLLERRGKLETERVTAAGQAARGPGVRVAAWRVRAETHTTQL
jgi:hypothetical protein